MTKIEIPKITDNDRDEITAVLDGNEIRGWSYADEVERRVKMRAAHEFAEGWYQCRKRVAADGNTNLKPPIDWARLIHDACYNAKADEIERDLCSIVEEIRSEALSGQPTISPVSTLEITKIVQRTRFPERMVHQVITAFINLRKGDQNDAPH